MSAPAVSAAATLWRRLLAHLTDRRPLVAAVAAKATADSIDGFTLTIYVPHLSAMILERPEVHIDLEIILCDLTSHQVLELHIIRTT